MGDAKPWYQSKTMLVNLSALVVWIVKLAIDAAQAGELPEELAPYAVLIVLGGNLLLRIFTGQPVELPKLTGRGAVVLLCCLLPSTALAGEFAPAIDVSGSKDRLTFCVPLGNAQCEILVQIVDGELNWSLSVPKRPIGPVPEPKPDPLTPSPPAPQPGPPAEGEFGIAPKLYAAAILAGGDNAARLADCIHLAKRCREIAADLSEGKSTVRAAGYAIVNEMANLSGDWASLKSTAKTELFALSEQKKLGDAAAFSRLLLECAGAFDAAAAKRK